MEIYDVVGDADGGFPRTRQEFVTGLRDIGKGKFRSCRLPRENGRVADMETTSPISVRTAHRGAVSRQKPPRLEDQLREAIRERHYSIRTEEAYVMWYRQFVRFHELRHPQEMGEAELTEFLKHLAVERDVAVETHRRALNTLLFFSGRFCSASW